MKYVNHVGTWTYTTNRFERCKFTNNRMSPTIISRVIDLLSTNDSISFRFYWIRQKIVISKNLLVLNYPNKKN